MSSKLNFRLLDALNIPNELEELIVEDIPEEIGEEDFKKNISAMSQDKLCEIIVCFRYLGLMQEESMLAMEELATRRANGEEFNFEDRIEELTKGLPSINIDINKMLKTLRM